MLLRVFHFSASFSFDCSLALKVGKQVRLLHVHLYKLLELQYMYMCIFVWQSGGVWFENCVYNNFNFNQDFNTL